MKAGPIRWNIVGLDVVQRYHGKVVVEHGWTQDSEITAAVIPAERDGQRWITIHSKRKEAGMLR